MDGGTANVTIVAQVTSPVTFESRIAARVAWTNATTAQFNGGHAKTATERYAVHVATNVIVTILRNVRILEPCPNSLPGM